MTGPTVGVIIPVRNGRQFIEQAISSALTQTHPPTAIAVVDDGSTDGTGDLVRETFRDFPGLIVLRTAGLGSARARDLALAHLETEFIALLDSDDYWYPSKTEVQLRAFGPDVVAVGSRMHYVGLKGRPFGATRGPLTPAEYELTMAGAYSPCPPSSMIIRGDAARLVGFRADILEGRIGQDLVFNRDVLRHGNLVLLDEVLGCYRVHGATESTTSHGRQMMVARYFETLSVRGLSEQELPFEDFAATFRLSRKEQRHERGAVMYRRAGSLLIDGDWVRGGPAMARALALHPRRTLSRLASLARTRLGPTDSDPE